MSRFALVSLLCLLCQALAPLGYARAQSGRAQEEPQGYRTAIDRAIEEFGLGNFAEARAQFAQANRIYPNARALRGLGMSEFELRHYVQATAFLERALSAKERALEGKARAETEALLARATGYVGDIALVLKPSSTSVLVDGTRVQLNAGQKLRLDIGVHTFEFHATGYVSSQREVEVQGSESKTLEVQLAPLVAEEQSAAPTPAEPQRADSTPVYKRWWLWTLVGVVVVGAAAGTAVALSLRDKSPDYVANRTENTPLGVGLSPLVRY